MSTKIRATVDALGNPTDIPLSAGQVHDLVGSDGLSPAREAKIVLADKAYDADEPVIEPLRAAGKQSVMPSKKNRKEPRPTTESYIRRAVWWKFSSATSNGSAPSPPAKTKPREISSLRFFSF